MFVLMRFERRIKSPTPKASSATPAMEPTTIPAIVPPASEMNAPSAFEELLVAGGVPLVPEVEFEEELYKETSALSYV